jgi:hypothetical protein
MRRWREPSTLQRRLVEARFLLGRAKRELGRYPGVVAVGVGLRQRGARHWPEACFVVEVRKKGEHKPDHLLPRSCEGLPVDVQERRVLELCSYPASKIQRVGHHEVGRTGLLVRNKDNIRFALTAMHVLGPDKLGKITNADTVMDVQLGTDPRAATGRLVYGVFDHNRDIACIELPGAALLSSSVGDTGFHFSEPSDLGALQVGASVGMVIGKGDVFSGTLVAYPLHNVDATFVTDLNVSVAFRNVAKFSFKMDDGAALAIQQGWSGSVIYRTDTFSPIALLSFRDDSFLNAYGFALMPAIQAGKLSIWKE